jgi:hypothetical protein
MAGVRAALWILGILGIVFLTFAVIGLVADFLDVTFFALVFGVGLVVLWVGVLFDTWRRADLGVASRIIWTLAIIFLPVLGTFLYIILRPPDTQVTYRGEPVT